MDKVFEEYFAKMAKEGEELGSKVIGTLDKLNALGLTLPSYRKVTSSFDREKYEFQMTISFERPKDELNGIVTEMNSRINNFNEVAEMIHSIKAMILSDEKKPFVPCSKDEEEDKSSSAQLNKFIDALVNKLNKEGEKHPHGIHDKLYKCPVAGETEKDETFSPEFNKMVKDRLDIINKTHKEHMDEETEKDKHSKPSHKINEMLEYLRGEETEKDETFSPEIVRAELDKINEENNRHIAGTP